MIISRTPLRMSFVGGGSDLAAFYKYCDGAVLSTSINKYVYLNLHDSFSNRVRAAYSAVEETDTFSQIKHPIVRNAAKMLGIIDGIEITSIADIPAKGSGLGSSSSFSVGLLDALGTLKGRRFSKKELAELACKLEIDMCGEPIGKQDQYAAAYGGFNIFRFKADESVIVEKLDIAEEKLQFFFSSLLVFYIGNERRASDILGHQSNNMKNPKKFQNIKKMVDLVLPFSNALQAGDLESCGQILHENWCLKKDLAEGITNSFIDKAYKTATSNGALGGKLLGAGAGGFLIFLAPQNNHEQIVNSLAGLKRVFFGYDNSGSKIIFSQ